jgi:DNA-binding NarL/FixJ family response regulator
VVVSGHTRGEAGTIAIVDDDPGLRALLSSLLEEAGYETWAVGSGEEALREARKARPSLVVLDVRLPGMCGYEVCRALRSSFGDELPILFISGVRTESFDRVAGLLVGGDDYVVKPFAADELVARVRALLRRTNAGNGGGSAASLTERELEVLRLLADGLEQHEIADRLVISPSTVGTHLEHVLGKLGVHSRAQAVAAAYRTGLMEAAARRG